jgi:FKBP-type peptidyl-prolyl cis-trans isomerase FkpA
MKSLLQCLFAALLCLNWLPAAQAQNKKPITTEHGFRFVNHTNKPGDKPKPGETIVLIVDTYIGDSLMGSTRASGGPRELKLYEKDKLPQRVPPIYDAVLLMARGDSGTVFQAIDSTIRPMVPPALQNNKDIRFEVVLVDFKTREEMAKKEAAGAARLVTIKNQVDAIAKEFHDGKLGDKLVKTASGLQLIINEKGSGKPVQKGQSIKANYYGCLSDGKMFDNSYERGEPLEFPVGVGQMIPGFDEGAQLLNHGGKATLFIPYQLGYGEEGIPNGPIPPKADLIFYIELD